MNSMSFPTEYNYYYNRHVRNIRNDASGVVRTEGRGENAGGGVRGGVRGGGGEGLQIEDDPEEEEATAGAFHHQPYKRGPSCCVGRQ